MTLDTDTKVQVINNLTSSSTTAALSANQGRLLNSSVSNGKTQVANAITGKGVAASGSDSFATLANKISQIVSGGEKYEIADYSGSSSLAFWAIDPPVMTGTVTHSVDNRFSQGNGNYVAYGYGRYSTNSSPSLCWSSSGSVADISYNLSFSENSSSLNVNFNYTYRYSPGWYDGFIFTNLIVCKRFS